MDANGFHFVETFLNGNGTCAAAECLDVGCRDFADEPEPFVHPSLLGFHADGVGVADGHQDVVFGSELASNLLGECVVALADNGFFAVCAH